MKILGIDPGSRKIGWSILNEGPRKKIEYINSGVLKFSSDNIFQRLMEINKEISKIVQEYKPDQVALESLIYVKNPSSIIKISQARGALIASLQNPFEVYEYSPNLIKSSVTGQGHSSKMGVQKTLQLILGQKISFASDDESDALAIAICHILNKKNTRSRMELR